jgi:hypothetical protein
VCFHSVYIKWDIHRKAVMGVMNCRYLVLKMILHPWILVRWSGHDYFNYKFYFKGLPTLCVWRVRSRNREYDCRDRLCWPRDTLYPQKLAVSSPTSGGRSFGIVRSQTQAMELSLVFLCGWRGFFYVKQVSKLERIFSNLALVVKRWSDTGETLGTREKLKPRNEGNSRL